MKKSANFDYRLSIIALLFLLLCLPAFAQEKDLAINAQNLNYSDDGKIIEATGSVEVTYNDLILRSNKILYFTDSKRIQSDSEFELSYQGFNFFGQKLDFKLKEKTGTAEAVRLLYKNVTLHGKTVKIDPEKIELNEADFTTCDLSTTHYHFHARDILLYPDDGWLLCYWAVFWADGVPTMPVPIYFYDFKSADKGQTNAIPFPQFGSNDQDGSYILQSFPWQINRKINGNILFGYADKKGFGEGMDAKYATNDQNAGNFKIFSYAKDPITAALNHSYYFGSDVADPKQFTFKLFNLPTLRQYELSTSISLNARLNYERMSMLPVVGLTLHNGSYQKINFDWNIGAGYITEESSGVGLYRGFGKLNLSTSIWEGPLGKLIPKLSNEGIFFNNGARWLRTIGELQLDNVWNPNFSTGIGYNHYFMNRGASPYNFENYRLVLNDQVFAGFLAGTDTSKFGINAVYNMPNLEPQEFDYIMRAGIHCFSVIINYRAMRKIFDFGFAIN